MNNETRRAVVQGLVDGEWSLIDLKGTAYAGTEDSLKNFKDVAGDTGLTKYQVWAVYFGKHLGSVHNAIKQNPQLPVDRSEGMKSRILDLRTYLGLLQCMIEEDEAANGNPTGDEL